MPYPFDVYISSDFGNDTTGNGDEGTPYASLQGFIDNHAVVANTEIGFDNTAEYSITGQTVIWNNGGGNMTTTAQQFSTWDRAANGSKARFNATGTTQAWMTSGSNKRFNGLEFYGNASESAILIDNVSIQAWRYCDFTQLGGGAIRLSHQAFGEACRFFECSGAIFAVSGRGCKAIRCYMENLTQSMTSMYSTSGNDSGGFFQCIALIGSGVSSTASRIFETRGGVVIEDCMAISRGGIHSASGYGALTTGHGHINRCYAEGFNIGFAPPTFSLVAGCRAYNCTTAYSTFTPDAGDFRDGGDNQTLAESMLVDADNDDFTPKETFAQKGWPTEHPQGTLNYPDPGAIQRQVTGGGAVSGAFPVRIHTR